MINATFKSIEASRITMPDAPRIDPVPFMDVYEHPGRPRLSDLREPPPPRSSIMASPGSKLALLKLGVFRPTRGT